MQINTQLLDDLTEQAKSNPRLRQSFDLRNSPEDGSQRILNAMEPGTVLPIHRHRGSSETVVMLRGKGRWNYYDDERTLTESIILDVDDEVKGLSAPKDQCHKAEALVSGTVILECKDGAYKPLSAEDILNE